MVFVTLTPRSPQWPTPWAAIVSGESEDLAAALPALDVVALRYGDAGRYAAEAKRRLKTSTGGKAPRPRENFPEADKGRPATRPGSDSLGRL